MTYHPDTTRPVYYNTEFLEAGPAEPIRLISIGMVADDGGQLYRIVDDRATINAAMARPWLAGNVIPHLPVRPSRWSADGWDWDQRHRDYPCVQPRDQVAADVRAFMLGGAGRPELWADHGAYDHVVLCQLIGSGGDRAGLFTRDLQDAARRAGNPRLPVLPGARPHHPLDDAREVAYRVRWLSDRMGGDRFEEFAAATISNGQPAGRQAAEIAAAAREYAAWLIQQAARGQRVTFTPGRTRVRPAVVQLTQSGPGTFGGVTEAGGAAR